MLNNFEDSDEILYTTMSDIPVSTLEENREEDRNATITACTTKLANGTIKNTPVSELPELEPIVDKVKQERIERGLSLQEFLFISVAWIVLPAFHFFKLCPEVIWCDVTSHSNNKGYCLLTFSCRTSIDKQVVFLWIWIPNEQRFGYRWVFQHVIPILIPKIFRDRVRMIMKDGCPQQRNEILRSLIAIFPNATEAGCGWHIG